MGPKKLQLKLLHVRGQLISSKPTQATDWPHFNFILRFILPHKSESKKRAGTRSRYGVRLVGGGCSWGQPLTSAGNLAFWGAV